MKTEKLFFENTVENIENKKYANNIPLVCRKRLYILSVMQIIIQLSRIFLDKTENFTN